MAHGPIPARMLVLHSCDNPPCCNERHLFLGTYKDNEQDKIRKGRRTFCRRYSKLNPEIVKEIRLAKQPGKSVV